MKSGLALVATRDSSFVRIRTEQRRRIEAFEARTNRDRKVRDGNM